MTYRRPSVLLALSLAVLGQTLPIACVSTALAAPSGIEHAPEVLQVPMQEGFSVQAELERLDQETHWVTTQLERRDLSPGDAELLEQYRALTAQARLLVTGLDHAPAARTMPSVVSSFEQYDELLSDLVRSRESSEIVRESLESKDREIAAFERRGPQSVSPQFSGMIASAELFTKFQSAKRALAVVEYRALRNRARALESEQKSLEAALHSAGATARLSERTLLDILSQLEEYQKLILEQREGALRELTALDQKKLPQLLGSIQESKLDIYGRRIDRLSWAIEAWKRRHALLNGQLQGSQLRALQRSHSSDIERLERELQSVNLLKAAARQQRIAAETENQSDSIINELSQVAALYDEELLQIDSARSLAARMQAELQERVPGNVIARLWGGIVDSFSAIIGYEVLVTADDRPVTAGKLLIGLLLVLLGGVASRRVSRIVGQYILPRCGFRRGPAAAFESLLYYGLIVACTALALKLVSVPLTVFTVLGGALAIGVGFGSQTIMSNFISGLIILVEQPIRPGDLIEIAGQKGTVHKIGARSSTILTKSHLDVVVPNSDILQKSLVNWTRSESTVKLSIAVGVAYASDPDLVRELLLESAAAHPEVLKSPAPSVLLSDFADSALKFELHVWASPHSFQQVDHIQSDLREAILRAFRAHNVTIPFPQRDLHIYSSSTKGELLPAVSISNGLR